MPRASAGVTPVRAGALLVLLLALGGLYGLSTSTAFTLRRTEVTGAAWTAPERIVAALGVPAGQNVFTVNPGELAGRLAAIPAVQSARITVSLPDSLVVAVREREALVVWRTANRQYLVDASGLLFGDLEGAPAGAADALPAVVDARAAGQRLAVGSAIDPVTLDAALRLGSLVPADLGSTAAGLAIRLDDIDGFTLGSVPGGWDAVFGFYTPTLRTTDLIPGQVRLLRSLLSGREAKVGRVILADDRSGTYLPRGSAGPSGTPKPSAAAGAGASPKPRASATPRPTKRPASSPGPSPTPQP